MITVRTLAIIFYVLMLVFGAGFGIMWWYLARSSSLLFFLPVYLIVSFLGVGLTRVLTK